MERRKNIDRRAIGLLIRLDNFFLSSVMNKVISLPSLEAYAGKERIQLGGEA